MNVFLQMALLFCSLLLSSDTLLLKKPSAAFQPHSSSSSQTEFAVQISVKNHQTQGCLVYFSTALFVLARQSSFMMGFVEWLRIDALPSSLTVLMLAQNFKILQGSVQRPFIHWNDPKAVKLCGSSDRLMMRLSQLSSSWEWLLLAESSVTLVWSTIAHIILLETFRYSLILLVKSIESKRFGQLPVHKAPSRLCRFLKSTCLSLLFCQKALLLSWLTQKKVRI
ncbi:unnamed protein product [Gongylonema pulchrum]|uniref:GP46-like surface antigen n=1 Tax=Gongylonema pulchrum TaxID=637853 RepID=A0A183ETQ3_9BILA|nr:unnamed protein product [Gongylonema pulchrum]